MIPTFDLPHWLIIAGTALVIFGSAGLIATRD
jgi:Sec-independent protein translocase protein TatA